MKAGFFQDISYSVFDIFLSMRKREIEIREEGSAEHIYNYLYFKNIIIYIIDK